MFKVFFGILTITSLADVLIYKVQLVAKVLLIVVIVGAQFRILLLKVEVQYYNNYYVVNRDCLVVRFNWM